MGIEALIKGIKSRALPQADNDAKPSDIRLTRYGEICGVSNVRKQHALIDEGSYFLVNNAQTGILTSNLGTAFAQTTLSPTLIITNSDSPSNLNAKRIYLDWLHLMVTASGGSAGTPILNFAWTTDGIERYSSGGTDLTGSIVSPNTDVARNVSIARIRFGALTLINSTGASRTLVGQRQLRQATAASSAGIVPDTFLFTHGNVEPNVGTQIDLSTAKASAGAWIFQIPGMVIGPTHCAILHLWATSALTTGITFLPELAWWER